jgi:hypothetical protein
MEYNVGACGRFCNDCQFFMRECQGCFVENEKLDKKCMIYKCVKEKEVSHCLKCPTTIYKCKIMQGLSKSYCLVVALREYRKGLS